MRRAVFFLLLAAIPCRAQWKDTRFPVKVLAFGVHDTNLFLSNVPLDGMGNGSYLDSLIFRYQGGAWIALGAGTDRTQGNITSFASLGQYFFAAMGFDGIIYSSTNNGGTWVDQINDAGGPIATNGKYLFANSATAVARSTDGGITWPPVPCPPATHFATKGTLILASTSKGLYRSTDSGTNWSSVTTPISNIQCFAVVDTVVYASNGVPGKGGGQLMKSTDSGATWQLMATSFDVSSLASDSLHLFAGGTQGVYMLNADGQTWTYESDQDVLKGHGVVALGVFDTLLFADFAMSNPAYQLYSRSIPEMTAHSGVRSAPPIQDALWLYPNPTAGAITIHSESTNIEVATVRNVLGANVLTVSSAHASDLTLDLSQLPSGTYFLLVTRSDGSVVRKIIRE